jgi:small GTP-binding protein
MESDAGAPSAVGRERRQTLKVIVCGNGAVGKTSLIRQYATAKFSEERNRTLGIDITTHELRMGGRERKLAIWDIEGQAGDRPFFYYGAQAALLVYDVTLPETLEGLVRWYERVKSHAPEGTPILIAGNKIDLEPSIPHHWGRAFAERARSEGHLFMSARTGEHVARAFNRLTELALRAIA